jgi:DNA-binding transcriptional MocR family regulator
MLQVCHRYDLLILEDDAYFYLYWGNLAEKSLAATGTSLEALSTGQVSNDLSLQASPKPPPSFLSMDVDGRVLRVDTLAKVGGG